MGTPSRERCGQTKDQKVKSAAEKLNRRRTRKLLATFDFYHLPDILQHAQMGNSEKVLYPDNNLLGFYKRFVTA